MYALSWALMHIKATLGGIGETFNANAYDAT
jgi:hypothetical protein